DQFVSRHLPDYLTADDLGISRRGSIVVGKVEVRYAEVKRPEHALPSNISVAISPERLPGAQRDCRQQAAAPAPAIDHTIIAIFSEFDRHRRNTAYRSPDGAGIGTPNAGCCNAILFTTFACLTSWTR